MQLCEELHAEPVWTINVGISHTESATPAELKPWLADAMDSLEFILGKSKTT